MNPTVLQQPFFQVTIPLMVTFIATIWLAGWSQNKRLDEMGKRFDEISKRFDEIAKRLDTRIDNVLIRLDEIIVRLGRIEQKLDLPARQTVKS
jgi:hypothetical protein